MNQKEKQLVSEAQKHALEILHQCVTPYGFRASADPAGYPQVWGRDSAVTFLGALACGDPDLIDVGIRSMETIGTAQSCWGLLPLNVNPDSGAISTENAGACDVNLWYILSQYAAFCSTGDKTLNCAIASHAKCHSTVFSQDFTALLFSTTSFSFLSNFPSVCSEPKAELRYTRMFST